MDIAGFLSALLMGAVEGLTEFLPISSTGHLILLRELIGFQGPPGNVFEIAIQLGAILAVVVVYWGDLWRIAGGMWRPGTVERYAATNILLAFLPALFIGALLHGPINRLLFNPWVVAVALILGGVAIILIERKRHAPTIASIPEIGPVAALLIGFGQVLAMIPGTSRSGATIITALLLGVERRTAAEFSFLLAIPTMLAATVYSLWKARARPRPLRARADRRGLRGRLRGRPRRGADRARLHLAHRLHALRLVPDRPRRRDHRLALPARGCVLLARRRENRARGRPGAARHLPAGQPIT